MGKLHIKVTSDLSCPVYNAFHEGRIVLVGKKQRKRILHKTARGAFYVDMGTAKNKDRKVYMSQGGIWVITNGKRPPKNEVQ